MKLNKLLVTGMSCVLLTCTMTPAEAGFNWSGIANKVANKATDSILSSGSKKQTNNKNEQAKKDAADKTNAQSSKPESKPTAYAGQLDPLPPDEFSERPDWFDNRTNIYDMTNARLVAEYENMDKWRAYAKESGVGWVEPDMFRYDELGQEIHHRIRALDRYMHNIEGGWYDLAAKSTQSPEYKRAVSSNIEPLRKHGAEINNPAIFPGYHPEVN